MSFTNYEELKEAVLDQSHMSNQLNRFDRHLALCDVEIRTHPDGALKMNISEKVSVATTSTTERALALPDGLQYSRNFNITINGGIHNLEFRTPEQLFIRRGAGIPCFFTIRGNQIEFDTLPDKEYQVEITYTANADPLTKAAPVNDILTKYPNIYLFGCLKQIYIWSQDTEEASVYDGLFSEAIASANMAEHDIKYQSQPQETVAWSP